jgi:excisionase family DNA binding protein
MQQITDNRVDGRSDYIWGAEAIAKHLNRRRSAIYTLARAGVLPATKVGKTWVTTRTHLDAFVRGAIDTRADH